MRSPKNRISVIVKMLIFMLSFLIGASNAESQLKPDYSLDQINVIFIGPKKHPFGLDMLDEFSRLITESGFKNENRMMSAIEMPVEKASYIQIFGGAPNSLLITVRIEDSETICTHSTRCMYAFTTRNEIIDTKTGNLVFEQTIKLPRASNAFGVSPSYKDVSVELFNKLSAHLAQSFNKIKSVR